MNLFLANLRPAISITVLMTAVLGLGYPLAMTAVGQALFPVQANGSLIEKNGAVVGSALIGQGFKDPRYLIGRPSAVDYDAANSSGSNLGPTSQALIEGVTQRVNAIRELDGVRFPTVDRVTASGSGLDPHIRVASALQQAERIARRRGVEPARVVSIIEQNIEGEYLGFIGERVVNVLLVNLALDEAFPPAVAPTGNGTPASEASVAR